MKVAPDAEVDDGAFDVVAIGDLGFGELLTSGRRLYKGTHLAMDKVTSRRARVVEAEPIDPGAIVELDVDGENPGRLPARFEIVPAALWMVVPASGLEPDAARGARQPRRELARGADRGAAAGGSVRADDDRRRQPPGRALARPASSRSRAGIAAGLELVTFDRFVERDVGGDEARASWLRRSIARSSPPRSRRCSPIASVVRAAARGRGVSRGGARIRAIARARGACSSPTHLADAGAGATR